MDIKRKKLGEIYGIAVISHKIKNRNRPYVGGIELYEGKILNVIDRNSDGDCLVMAKNGIGLGDVLAEDIVTFIPIQKKNGVIMPSDLTPMEEYNWFSKAYLEGIESFNTNYVLHCIKLQKIDKNYINL